jgi:hypothetical protein
MTITIGAHENGETLCLDGNLYPQSAEGKIHFKVYPQVLDVFI